MQTGFENQTCHSFQNFDVIFRFGITVCEAFQSFCPNDWSLSPDSVGKICTKAKKSGVLSVLENECNPNVTLSFNAKFNHIVPCLEEGGTEHMTLQWFTWLALPLLAHVIHSLYHYLTFTEAMMTPWHRNAFHVTGLCEEGSTGHWWIPSQGPVTRDRMYPLIVA